MRQLARALDEYDRVIKLARGSEHEPPSHRLTMEAGQDLAKSLREFIEEEAETNALMYKKRAEAELTEATRMIVSIDDKSLGISEKIQYAAARAQLGRLAAHLADLCYWPDDMTDAEANKPGVEPSSH